MKKNTDSIEVIGAFVLGITKTFYNLSAITQTECDNLTSDIGPNEWYPVKQLLDIFTLLEKSNRSHPSLMFQAGYAFIQAWYDNGGKELNHGSVGQMKLQDNSMGLKMVMRNFDTKEFYSKILHLDVEKGIFQVESSNFFSIDFTKGVFTNGLLMWGDLHWVDVKIEVLESFKYSKKFLINTRFKLKKDLSVNEKIKNYISNLKPEEKEPAIDPQMAIDLAWKVKGLEKNLQLQNTINKFTNNILGDALEVQHQTSLELKKSNDTKDKLFSIISHDLKAPFNNLIGFFELLIDRYDEHSEEFRKKIIHKIYQSSLNSHILLSNLLAWSKNNLNKNAIVPVSFLINETIESIISFTKDSSEQKNIKVVYEPSDKLTVFTDQEMIKTVLRNIISNAIKFTNRNGLIDITSTAFGNNILVCVKDDGIGIPQKKLVNIFSSDFDKSTRGTNNESGTGLGLLICKEFVEKNNGKIWVESELGKGSSFYFTLPMAK